MNAEMINFRDIIRAVFKRKVLLTGVIVVFLVCAWFMDKMTVPKFRSEAKILVSSSRKKTSSFFGDLNALRRATPAVNHGEIVKSSLILGPVVDELGLSKRDDSEEYYSSIRKKVQPVINKIMELLKNAFSKIKSFIFPERTADSEKMADPREEREEAICDLRKKMSIYHIEDSDIFYVTVRDYSADMAQKLADAISLQYVLYDLELQGGNLRGRYGENHPEVMQLNDQIEDIKALISSSGPFDDIVLSEYGTVRIVDPANLPTKPYWPRAVVLYPISFSGALLFGLGLIFILEGLGRTYNNPWEFEESTGVSVLGSVPERKGFLSPDLFENKIKDKGPYPEAYKNIADNIFMALKGKGRKTIVISDINDSAKSAANAYNIGVIFAQMYGMKVLVVDGDMRESVLTGRLKKRASGGFCDMIANDMCAEEVITHLASEIDFLPVGDNRHNPLILLMSEAVDETLAGFRDCYDLVIITSPAASKYKDTMILGEKDADIIFSLSESNNKIEIVRKTLEDFSGERVNVLGAIFNDRTWPIPKRIYRKI